MTEMNRRDALKSLMALPAIASGAKLPILFDDAVEAAIREATSCKMVNKSEVEITFDKQRFYGSLTRNGALTPNDVRRMEL